MTNIAPKKKVALTVACNLVQVGVAVAADDEDLNFIQAAAAECFEPSMSGTWQQRDRRIVNQPVTVENFVTVTIPTYSITEFRQHFRMSRCCFQVTQNCPYSGCFIKGAGYGYVQTDPWQRPINFRPLSDSTDGATLLSLEY